ncbi:MAG TPA: lipopolysaccharide biosynthesis protein [Planctomycetota bacterium]|nr:lipopolysaccharide biosynthesis protein [Planctomycetota bacterium]
MSPGGESPSRVRHPLRFIKNRFVRDAATLQVSGLMNQASQFVSSIGLVFLLGEHGFGQFITAVVLQALFYNLVNVGVVQATITQVAAANVRDSRVKLAGWLAFLVKTYLIFSVVLIGVGWLALPAAAEAWYGDRQLGVWAWWLTFWPLIDTPRAVAQVAFQGTRRMLSLGQLDNGQELIRMFLVVLGAAITGSPEGAVLGEIASRILASYLALDMYRSARSDGAGWLPSFREVLRRVPEIPLRQGIRLGLRVGILKNGSTLFMTVFPRLLVGAFGGMSWVAYFHIAQRILGLPQMMMLGISRTVLPALSELRGVRDLERFRRMFVRTTLIAGSLITAGILLALPLIPFVVRVFYRRPEFAEPVLMYAAILALGLVPHSFAVGLEAFYILTDQMRVSLLITAVGAAITIPLNFVLVEHFPRTGAAWGLSLYMSWVLVHFLYVAFYFKTRAREGHWDR